MLCIAGYLLKSMFSRDSCRPWVAGSRRRRRIVPERRRLMARPRSDRRAARLQRVARPWGDSGDRPHEFCIDPRLPLTGGGSGATLARSRPGDCPFGQPARTAGDGAHKCRKRLILKSARALLRHRPLRQRNVLPDGNQCTAVRPCGGSRVKRTALVETIDRLTARLSRAGAAAASTARGPLISRPHEKSMPAPPSTPHRRGHAA